VKKGATIIKRRGEAWDAAAGVVMMDSTSFPID
jgi:hypothetical protein